MEAAPLWKGLFCVFLSCCRATFILTQVSGINLQVETSNFVSAVSAVCGNQIFVNPLLKVLAGCDYEITGALGLKTRMLFQALTCVRLINILFCSLIFCLLLFVFCLLRLWNKRLCRSLACFKTHCKAWYNTIYQVLHGGIENCLTFTWFLQKDKTQFTSSTRICFLYTSLHCTVETNSFFRDWELTNKGR